MKDKDTEPIMMTFAEVQELERLRQENRELKKRITEIHEAAKRVHDAVTELDCLICL
jgi:cell shape-determining protein MreC